MKHIIIITFLILLTVGCKSTNNQALKHSNYLSMANEITINKSTKEDVRRNFGNPRETSHTEGGNEVWRYVYTESTAKATNYVPIIRYFDSGENIDTVELIVTFNKQGIVKNYSIQNGESETTKMSYQPEAT